MLPSERKTLERAAESAGKPLSTLLRECAIAMHGDDLLGTVTLIETCSGTVGFGAAEMKQGGDARNFRRQPRAR